MRLIASLSAVAAALLISPSLGRSQEKGEDTTFRSETNLVVLHATVADRTGKFLPNLQQGAFHVFENGVEQAVRLFRREDVPVSLGLIVDNSGSMRDKRRRVESAALAMVKASNPQDEVFIVNFNDQAFRDVDFTNNLKKMEEGLTRIDSRGGTAMRDALMASLDHIKKKAKHDKKVLVVITDGNDTASSADNTLEKLAKQAQQDEVLLYMVGLLSEEEKREAKKARRALEALARASGGSAAFPAEPADVERIAVGMAGEIRNQYTIGYSPTSPELDGTFRSVRVTVDAPNRPVARTRSGYYATPDRQKPKSAGTSAASRS